jgi:hypothetical protein
LLNSLAWPAAVVVTVVVLRRELSGAFHRVQSIEFPGGRATFAALENYSEMIATVTKAEGTSPDQAIVRYERTEFSILDALATAAPEQAIIDAWGLLEYQLNVASDRLAPDQPHGWPQVAHNLEKWDKWYLLYPVALELRRLRDYTVHSSRPPAASDAARYVSVAQDLVTALRVSPVSQSGIREQAGGTA